LVQAEKKGWVSILFFSLIDLTSGGLNHKLRRKAALGLGVESQPELAHLDQISFPPDQVHAIRLSFLESLEAKAHQTFGFFSNARREESLESSPEIGLSCQRQFR